MATENLFLVEKSLLKGKWDPQIPDSTNPAFGLAKLVSECQFRDAFRSQIARKLFRPLSASDLNHSFQDFLDLSVHPGSDPIQEEVIRLSLAVAGLHAFAQANWTGPDLNISPLEVFTDDSGASDSLTEESFHTKAISELAHGGEPAYHLAKAPAFLRLSQILLAQPYNHLQSIPWWRLRVSILHQRILDEPVALINDFRDSLVPLTSTLGSEPDLVGRMYLELGLLEHHFSQDKSAAEYFVKAARATGLEYELTGALGKRTKFQVTELSQLVLLAESRLNDDESTAVMPAEKETTSDTHSSDPGMVKNKNIPEGLALNDDTLLEQTEFTSSKPAGVGSLLTHIDPSAQPPLHPLDQCILLSLCLNVRNTSPSHGLTTEQMSPYVSRVISHPRNWSVHTMALLLRSRLESSRTRTVERSTFQLQALIDQMPTADSTTPERLLYFHSIPLPSRWEMEKELAQRFLSLGVVKSALEIYERLEMWEEVVNCYGALEKPEKGIAIVRDLLEGRKAEVETVISRGKSTSNQHKSLEDTTREAKLWCLLGDLEPEHAANHYEHAWSVSKETSGRAMRSLGGYYFARARYSDAIVCLKRAVKINPLLTRSWFILGCACMRVEDWEEAKNAFSRCVAIDEEDGESWNNLASMYLRMGIARKIPELNEMSTLPSLVTDHDAQEASSTDTEAESNSIPFENKLLAFRALKQGLRYSYENWRMWFNYMVVAMDVGELQEACRALGRIVDQTGDKAGAQAVDEDVLDRLVDAVTRAPSKREEAVEDDALLNPNEGHGLSRNVLDLFERTILPRMSTPRIFRAYGRLQSWQHKWEEAIKAYLDGYRCSNAGTFEKGETDTAKWREAVADVEDIVDILRNFGPRVEGYKWKLQARSIVRTFVGRTRDFEDESEWTRLTELQDDLRKEGD
ncbi:tetratricopeptide repeat domain 27 [Crassisporium funariophilum]|nr:tetratricopeptide repeat domain 27 [Crassisporium funariophilum]